MFAGSLRDTGYSGDIVVAVAPGSDPGFLAVWKHYHCVVYTVQSNCVGEDHDKKCSFDIGDGSPPVSINMLRFYMYQWWGRKYQQNALILVSDFRDVFFQSNPFTYKPQDWAPPVAQFVAFQEAYPNKVINRCIFNGGWIRGCYGEEGLQRVGTNTVSCSGNSIANKDALVIYVSYLFIYLSTARQSLLLLLDNKKVFCFILWMPMYINAYYDCASSVMLYMSTGLFDGAAAEPSSAIRERHFQNQRCMCDGRHGPRLPQLAALHR